MIIFEASKMIARTRIMNDMILDQIKKEEIFIQFQDNLQITE